MSFPSAPSSLLEASSPSRPPINPTRAEKLHAFRIKANDPTSSPYLAFILVDLFCCLGYLAVTAALLYYARDASVWISAFSFICALLYAVQVRGKWNLRRDALSMRRRRSEENQLLERMWDRDGDAGGERFVGVEEKEGERSEV